jgi:hypothetical protein
MNKTRLHDAGSRKLAKIPIWVKSWLAREWIPGDSNKEAGDPF